MQLCAKTFADDCPTLLMQLPKIPEVLLMSPHVVANDDGTGSHGGGTGGAGHVLDFINMLKQAKSCCYQGHGHR